MRWFETTNDSLRKHEKLKKKCWQSRTLSIRKSFFVVQHRIEPHELTNSTINISSTLVHWCFRWGRGGCSGPARVHPILHQKPFMSNEVYPTLNCSWPIRAQIGGGTRRCNHTWGGGRFIRSRGYWKPCGSLCNAHLCLGATQCWTLEYQLAAVCVCTFFTFNSLIRMFGTCIASIELANAINLTHFQPCRFGFVSRLCSLSLSLDWSAASFVRAARAALFDRSFFSCLFSSVLWSFHSTIFDIQVFLSPKILLLEPWEFMGARSKINAIFPKLSLWLVRFARQTHILLVCITMWHRRMYRCCSLHSTTHTHTRLLFICLGCFSIKKQK